jgi:hypothetical protein
LDLLQSYRSPTDGKLIRYTPFGSYPVLYLDNESNVFCGKCANDAESEVVCGGVHWEGDPLTCDECQEEIESAYGPIEGESDRGCES